MVFIDFPKWYIHLFILVFIGILTCLMESEFELIIMLLTSFDDLISF